MKEDQETRGHERKPQGVASATTPAEKTSPGKEGVKRKGEEEKKRLKPERLSRAASAGQRK